MRKIYRDGLPYIYEEDHLAALEAVECSNGELTIANDVLREQITELKKMISGFDAAWWEALHKQITALKAEKEIILDAGTSESNLVVHLQAENQRQTEEIKRLREEIKRVVGVMTGTVFYGGLPQDAMLKIAQDALKQEEVK